MRVLLKILLFPVTLALSIVVGVCRLACVLSGTGLFNGVWGIPPTSKMQGVYHLALLATL